MNSDGTHMDFLLNHGVQLSFHFKLVGDEREYLISSQLRLLPCNLNELAIPLPTLKVEQLSLDCLTVTLDEDSIV